MIRRAKPATLALAVVLGSLGAFFIHRELAPRSPRMFIEQEALQMNDLVAGQVLRHTIPIANAGKAPLELEVAGTSCGCTQASLSQSVVEPGAIAELSVTIAVPSEGSDFSASITLRTNETGESSRTIGLSGKISHPVILSKNLIQFGRIDVKSLPLEIEVDAIWTDEMDMEVLRPKAGTDFSTFRVRLKKKETGYSIFVTIPATAPIGSISDTLHIRWTESFETSIPILADVFGPVHLSSRTFFFDSIQSGVTHRMDIEISPAFAPVSLSTDGFPAGLSESLTLSSNLDRTENILHISAEIDGSSRTRNLRSYATIALTDSEGIRRSVHLPIIIALAK